MSKNKEVLVDGLFVHFQISHGHFERLIQYCNDLNRDRGPILQDNEGHRQNAGKETPIAKKTNQGPRKEIK